MRVSAETSYGSWRGGLSYITYCLLISGGCFLLDRTYLAPISYVSVNMDQAYLFSIFGYCPETKRGGGANHSN